jgi:hypothetical protein
MPHLLTLLLLLPAFAFAGEPSPLKALTLRPSAASLQAFTRACNHEHLLDFSGGKTVEDAALKKARRSGNLFLLRGLIFAYGHCTDGASTESLQMFLGNDALLKHTKSLLEAIAAENAGIIARDLAQAEDENFFALDCQDEKCKSAKARFYQRKVKALRLAKASAAAQPIKAGMLDAITVVP